MYGLIIAFKDFWIRAGILTSPWVSPWYIRVEADPAFTLTLSNDEGEALNVFVSNEQRLVVDRSNAGLILRGMEATCNPLRMSDVRMPCFIRLALMATSKNPVFASIASERNLVLQGFPKQCMRQSEVFRGPPCHTPCDAFHGLSLPNQPCSFQ